MARFKLKLKRLDFISAVDAPAQETATALLIKGRAGAAQITATARVVKTSDELGLVFGWALTTKANGADYFDLHGDNIVEDDLIRVAAEFMANGGATDQQHDFAADGRVVFAMPLTAEVAKSFGIQTDTTGLMVAIRPSADVFAKFKSGEYTGFSIAGIGERETVKAARVVKHQLATDEVDGHAHAVLIYEDGSLFVQHATSAGAEHSHSHGIITNADGSVSILADSGHTHELVGAAVIAVPADAVVVIQASASPTTKAESAKAAHAKSTRSAAMPHGGLTQEEFMSNTPDLAKQLADLTKRNERLERIAKMSGAHKAHFDTLGADDADAFLAKSNADRDSLLADVAKRNEEAMKIVYTSKSTGDVYRAKDDARLVDMAKRMDAQAEEIEKSAIRKSAVEHLGGLAGSDDVHDLIVRSVLKSGEKSDLVEQALTAMKGWKSLGKSVSVAKGFAGEDPSEENPQTTWDAEIVKTMAEHKVDRFKATDLLMATAKGREMYAAVSKAVKTRK